MEKKQNEKKKKELSFDVKIIGLIAALCILLIMIIAVPLSSSIRGQQGVIYVKAKGYVKFTGFLSFGSVLVTNTAKTYHKWKKTALNDVDDDYSFTILTLDDVVDIHLIPMKEKNKAANNGVSPFYVGNYTINAEGNNGYMYIRKKNGYVYGTIRFPKYANGVYEKMKYLVIKGNNISFTRSADTSAEVRYIGVSKRFKQQYRGVYKKGGWYITGTYKIPGSIRNWKAYKIK
jgi:hypothetical protein